MLSLFIGICFDVEIAKARYELQQISQEKSEKPYDDDGLGMMIIKEWNTCLIKEGYLQWKKDYPERAKKIISIAVSGGGSNYFMLIYETE
ncbi:hypothetical protein KKG85_01435 [Patescibacteria group bacterium]|nr:hypothetical protein [Patescibacteria group bacterium]MBU2579693.1 hypothetical protein [Patescibacteria group bacterium]